MSSFDKSSLKRSAASIVRIPTLDLIDAITDIEEIKNGSQGWKAAVGSVQVLLEPTECPDPNRQSIEQARSLIADCLNVPEQRATLAERAIALLNSVVEARKSEPLWLPMTQSRSSTTDRSAGHP